MKQVPLLLFFLLAPLATFAARANQSARLIDVDRVRSISYLVASGKGVGRSTFGHAYLRISYGKSLSEEDVTIEFVADVDPTKVEFLKGVGLGENYGIKVAKSLYSQVKRHHTMDQDRNMETYVLDLKPGQKRAMATKLNSILTSGAGKDYAFFTKNCADIASDVLNAGLDKEISGISSVIPVAIPGKLEKMGLVKEVHVDLSKSEQRKKIVKTSYPEALKRLDDLRALNLARQLASKKMSRRVMGYYKLHMLRGELGFMDGVKASALAAKLMTLEGRLARVQLTRLFAKRRTQMEEFGRVVKELDDKRARIRSTGLRVVGDRVYLEAIIRANDKDNRELFHLKELTYVRGRILDAKQRVVAYDVGDELARKRFVHPESVVKAEIVRKRGRTYFVSLLLTEKEEFRLNPPVKIGRKDEIAYKNGEFGQEGLGMCFAHSELSQKLNANAVFLPNAPKLSQKENLALVSELYQGSIVVIPGFNNAKEFSSSLPKQALGIIIKKRQDSAYSYQKRFASYFKETGVDQDNFHILQNLLEMGVSPVIAFKVRGNIGHSVLVGNIEEKEDHYILDVVDPNMTFQKGVYKFNKKSGKLNTVFYGEVEASLPYFDLDAVLLKKTIVNMPETRRALIQSAKNLRRFSFPARAFTQ